MGYRKMAKDEEGNAYVAERSVPAPPGGDAVLKVKTFTTAKHGDIVYWPTATYEVSAEGATAVEITRRGSGSYDVPGRASRVGMADAVRIALGRMEPPAARVRSARVVPATVRRTATAGDSTAANVKGSEPVVKQEPRDNWALKQGDRIMRHLALYPQGVGAQTLAAGMHELSTTQVRQYLRRMAKVSGGPVVEMPGSKKGVYARREA